MEEFQKAGKVEVAGLRAGMDRKTARRYIRLGKLPSELREPRVYRTRPDPFDAVWAGIEARLEDVPELEAKTLFEDLQERHPGKFEPGQLRTLQRRVKQWRAQRGPEKTVFFPQEHRPGEAGQTDFTHATELGITISGAPFAHMLCHFVLPYSNWESAKVCHSESLVALKSGIQKAVFQLGRVPEWHQTDHSTAATHKLSAADKGRPSDERPRASAERGFNPAYLGLMAHLGMKPRTIAVGEKEQNGDVEALNGALKRRAEQRLLLRGSRDFESVEEYEVWLDGVLAKANAQRTTKVEEDLEQMSLLRVERLAEFQECEVTVTSWSTIRVKRNTYSVPSRLIGERLRVRVFDNRLEVRHGGQLQLTCERLLGNGGSRIDYRHVIRSLVRKPGAFERYRYREALYPSLVFRRSFDALSEALPTRRAIAEYLRILKLAADTMESTVGSVLEAHLERGELPLAEQVKSAVAPEETVVPHLAEPAVDLQVFDDLLEADASELVEVLS